MGIVDSGRPVSSEVSLEMLSCAAQDISYQLTIFCSQDEDCGSNLKCVITKDFAQSLF